MPTPATRGNVWRRGGVRTKRESAFALSQGFALTAAATATVAVVRATVAACTTATVVPTEQEQQNQQNDPNVTVVQQIAKTSEHCNFLLFLPSVVSLPKRRFALRERAFPVQEHSMKGKSVTFLCAFSEKKKKSGIFVEFTKIYCNRDKKAL
jgi:hypothetical protein